MLDNSSRLRAATLASGLCAFVLGCEPNVAPTIPDVEPVVREREPIAAVEGDAAGNLLQDYIDRDPVVAGYRNVQSVLDPTKQKRVAVTWAEESGHWTLPFQSKRVVVALIIAAAHDRIESLDFLLTPDATWGWPDPRRPMARPVFEGDGGERFFSALKNAGARLPQKAKWISKPVPPGLQMLHLTGAEPMWTAYQDERDAILMQLVVYDGSVRISYIGLYDELPEQQPEVDDSYGPPPPMVPPLRPPPAGL